MNYKEERELLVPVGVNMKCMECEEGYLEVVDPNVQVSSTLAIWPPPKPTFEHVCTNDECDNRAYFENVYPGIEYDLLENVLKTES